ncbi:hypothetical protein HEP87_48375 [Streptomyces sp. S1D4-11]|nr:hypothetical protein [Streptomyces sp. S1D4-11]QIZ00224.1 hypothetical protein HEP87_48375 [Streptomyces sp. S1D4-11]
MTETAGTLHGKNSEADDVSAEPAEETLTSDQPGGDSLEPATADLLTGRSMDRRLPSLIRRTFSLAWEAGPKAVLALPACQVVSGVLWALGLFATTAAFAVLIETAHDTGRLREAIPAVSLLAAAAGVRALLGIATHALSNRL